MSRALGAAFLGHQVEQLENRALAGTPVRGSRGRGGRGRAGAPADSQARGNQANRGLRSGPRSGGGIGGGSTPTAVPPRDQAQMERKRSFTLHPDPDAEPIVPKEREKAVMANTIILDASILVHALGQVKRWCKDERKEILVIPLEGGPYFALRNLRLISKSSIKYSRFA